MSKQQGGTTDRPATSTGERDQPGERNRKEGREQQQRDVQGGGGGTQGGGGGQKD